MPPVFLIAGERRVQGSNTGSNRFRLDIPRYVELYQRGRLQLDALLTTRLRLDELEEGFHMMAKAEGIRSVVTFA